MIQPVGTTLLAVSDARRLPLPDGVAQCCVTSPPYFNLRDYKVPGQIGLEKTPDEYVANLVRVFREVRRVLTDSGVLWLNISDSFCNAGSRNNGTGLDGKRRGGMQNTDGSWKSAADSHRDIRHALGDQGIKHKDLIGIPWMLAFALRADGWYLRSDIVWSKRSPMPESVRDRPSKAHEYVFLLTKRPTYFYDWYAVLEKAKTDAKSKPWKEREYDQSMLGKQQANGVKGRPKGVAGYAVPGHRNLRSVWTLSNESFKGAHFAVMPSKLVIPCVKAGSSEYGCCAKCRSPWKRIVKSERVATRPGLDSKVYETPPVHPDSPLQSHAGIICGNRDPARHTTTYKHMGWEPTCKCVGTERVPCLVLDCFSGAGTVPLVASNLGRWGIGFDAGEQYCRMAYERINHPHLDVPMSKRIDKPLPLFDRLETS